MEGSWHNTILHAVEHLRSATTRRHFTNGSRAIVAAIDDLPTDVDWAPTLRNAAQPVVSYAEFLARGPEDPSLRQQLEHALEELTRAVEDVGGGG